MRLLKSLLFLILLGSIGYQANAYYRYRKAAEAVPPRVNTVTARGGTLRITLSGSGALQAQNSRVVSVREVQARISSIVEDGAIVKAGQVVAQLDTTQVLKDLRDRQTAFDTARAAVPKTEADVLLNLNNAATKAKKARQDQALLLTTNSATTQQAGAQLNFNGSELDKAKQQAQIKESLARDRLVPQQLAEEAGLNVQRKQLGVVTATKQLDVQQQAEKIGASQGEMLIEDAKFGEAAAKSKAEQQRENARFNMLQAKQMLEMSQRQLEFCTIKAPLSGLAVVDREWDPSQGGQRPLRVGDQVYPSRGLMEIIDTSKMIVQADVGEIDIGHVRKGQAARVFPRAAPGTALRARVKSVSEVAQTPPMWRANRTPGKKVFRVMLEVLEARPKLLRPEMTADFELVEEEIAQGVHVPIQSVFSRGSDRVVYLRKEGRYWPKKVTLGKRNDNDVLITQGLKAGDVLSEHEPPASLIGPGTRTGRPSRAGGLLSLLPWGFQR
jgi:multidrug efflux pump subunit AcrA (membrane-fusion protein)